MKKKELKGALREARAELAQLEQWINQNRANLYLNKEGFEENKRIKLSLAQMQRERDEQQAIKERFRAERDERDQRVQSLEGLLGAKAVEEGACGQCQERERVAMGRVHELECKLNGLLADEGNARSKLNAAIDRVAAAEREMNEGLARASGAEKALADYRAEDEKAVLANAEAHAAITTEWKRQHDAVVGRAEAAELDAARVRVEKEALRHEKNSLSVTFEKVRGELEAKVARAEMAYGERCARVAELTHELNESRELRDRAEAERDKLRSEINDQKAYLVRVTEERNQLRSDVNDQKKCAQRYLDDANGKHGSILKLQQDLDYAKEEVKAVCLQRDAAHKATASAEACYKATLASLEEVRGWLRSLSPASPGGPFGPSAGHQLSALQEQQAVQGCCTITGVTQDGAREPISCGSTKEVELVGGKPFCGQHRKPSVMQEIARTVQDRKQAPVAPVAQPSLPRCRHGHAMKVVESVKPGYLAAVPDGCALCGPEDEGIPYRGTLATLTPEQPT